MCIRDRYGAPYGTGGCTWFVGARVMELTGKGSYNTQVGETWYRTYGPNLGFTSDQNPSSGSVICWSGHVAILEKIEGSTAYISEGGAAGYRDGNGTWHSCSNNDYCKLSTCDVSSIPGRNSGFIGYVHFLSSENIGNDFYALIEPSIKVIHLENTGSNVQLTANNDDYNPKQIWHFLRQSNGSYKIISEYDGKCLDLYGANPANGTNISTYEDNGTNAQRWFLFNNSGGYGFRTACGSSVMDVTDLQFTAGTNMQIHEYNGSDAQRFTVYKISYTKPAKPSASTVSLWVLGSSNKTTWLSWTASALSDSNYDNRNYTLTLTKDGVAYQTKTELTSTSISLTLPKGTYTAKVRAINTKYKDYYTDSNTITFTVKDCPHYWDAGTITTAATCTKTGVRTFTCTACGATRTETISKTGHTITVINAREATYDADGYTGDSYCTVCKQTLSYGSSIPKLTKPNEPTNPEQPATNEQQQQSDVCQWCGKKSHNVFIYIIHMILAILFGSRY